MRWILLLYRVIRGAIKEAFREEISFSQQHKWGQYLPTWNPVGSHLEPGEESLLDCYCVREGKGFPFLLFASHAYYSFMQWNRWLPFACAMVISLYFCVNSVWFVCLQDHSFFSLTKLLFPPLRMCIFFNMRICSLKCTQSVLVQGLHTHPGPVKQKGSPL